MFGGGHNPSAPISGAHSRVHRFFRYDDFSKESIFTICYTTPVYVWWNNWKGEITFPYEFRTKMLVQRCPGAAYGSGLHQSLAVFEI